jgi:hypothetical protein
LGKAKRERGKAYATRETPASDRRLDTSRGTNAGVSFSTNTYNSGVEF